MKITDLTEDEIAAVLRGRNQPVPIEEPEDAPTYSAEQVDVLRCIDALTSALELYIPQGGLIQTRLIQAQYLLQHYAGFPDPAPQEEAAVEEEEETLPEKEETYTVG